MFKADFTDRQAGMQIATEREREREREREFMS